MYGMPIIEASGLTRRFDSFTAVEGINITVNEGEVLGFLGPNGAGKTTTIRMLAGIISPTAGTANVAGIRPDLEPERLHEVIGLLTERTGLYERLSARRNLEYFAGFYENINVAAQVEKYLKLMGLWDRRDDYAGGFSKGMKQRLALARALIHEPKIVFLDEPTSGLDPEAAHEVRDLIKKLSTEGRTIFISTHNLPEAESLCSRIAVIRTKLLALDTPDNLRLRFFHPQLIIHMAKVTDAVEAAARALPFVLSLKREESALTLELKNMEINSPEVVKAVVDAGARIASVTEERPTLEDIYLNLVRDKPENVK